MPLMTAVEFSESAVIFVAMTTRAKHHTALDNVSHKTTKINNKNFAVH